MSALQTIQGDGAGPHPFRIHFTDGEGESRSAVIWSMTPESARKAFAAEPKNRWARVHKIKLDRSKEHA